MVSNPRCDIWRYFNNIVEEGVAVCKLCNQRLKNERSFSLRKHINKLHNPKSAIWEHFDNIVEECVAVCKICEKRVRNNRHFNLIVHLKQHDISVEENENKTNTASKGVGAGNDLKCATKHFERSRENICINMDEKTLVGAVMGLMIDEGVPPQLFASKNMQALLNPVCDALSKQEDIKFSVDEFQSEQVLYSVASYIRDEFGNDLHWRLLSLRIDMDLNPNLNMFCISVQFVNGIQLETRILGEINIKDNQKQFAECIMDILHKFNIDSRQIVIACWDNSKSRLNNTISNSEYLREIQEFEKDPNVYVGDIKLERYIGVIAQLCVMDIFKNFSIFQLFKECRNMTKLINYKPHIFNERFKQNGLNIPQIDSPWKWGSTYTMMLDLKEALSAIENEKYEQPECMEDRFNINDNLKNFIDAFCKALIHVQKSAQKFYTSEMIYGDFYAQWLKCKILTEKLYSASEEGTILATISAELVKSIEYRSAELLNQDHFKACLYLDPRFQHTLNMPEKMFALEYLKQLWNRSKLYNTELVDPVPESRAENLAQTERFEEDDDALLNDFLSQSVQDTVSTAIYKKLEDLKLPYQTTDTNVLSYWKELNFCEPQIYTLSTICFAIPATQNYNKLNTLPIPLTCYNSNMCSDLKESLDLIRLNQHLLDKAVENLGLFREDVSSDNECSDNQSASPSSLAAPVANSPDINTHSKPPTLEIDSTKS